MLAVDESLDVRPQPGGLILGERARTRRLARRGLRGTGERDAKQRLPERQPRSMAGRGFALRSGA